MKLMRKKKSPVTAKKSPVTAKTNKSNRRKGDRKASGAPMSINVDGQPILEIDPEADREGVHELLDSLQRDVNAKGAARTAGRDNAKGKPGKSRGFLQRRLAARRVRSWGARDSRVPPVPKKDDSRVPRDAAPKKDEVAAAVLSNVSNAPDSVVRKEDVGASKDAAAEGEGEGKTASAEPEAAPSKEDGGAEGESGPADEEEATKDDETAPEREEGTPAEGGEEEEVPPAMGEATASDGGAGVVAEEGDAPAEGDADGDTLDGLIPAEEAPDGTTCAGDSTCGGEGTCGHSLEESVNCSVSFETSIETVEERDGTVRVGYFEEEIAEANTEDESIFGLSDLVYNLQLMIDGVVVQTMTLGAQGVDLLNCCISDARGDEERSDLVLPDLPSASTEDGAPPEARVPREDAEADDDTLEKFNDFFEGAKSRIEEEDVGDAPAPEEDCRNDDAAVDPAADDGEVERETS